PANGKLLARVDNYTQPFSGYVFNDKDQLITLGGTAIKPQDNLTWRLWNIDSGALLRADSITVSGDSVLRSSDAQLRYLTQTASQDGSSVDLTIIDGKADEKQTIHISPSSGMTLSQVVPNDDWTRFLIVYTGSDPDSGTVYPVEVYDR